MRTWMMEEEAAWAGKLANCQQASMGTAGARMTSCARSTARTRSQPEQRELQWKAIHIRNAPRARIMWLRLVAHAVVDASVVDLADSVCNVGTHVDSVPRIQL